MGDVAIRLVVIPLTISLNLVILTIVFINRHKSYFGFVAEIVNIFLSLQFSFKLLSVNTIQSIFQILKN